MFPLIFMATSRCYVAIAEVLKRATKEALGLAQILAHQLNDLPQDTPLSSLPQLEPFTPTVTR